MFYSIHKINQFYIIRFFFLQCGLVYVGKNLQFQLIKFNSKGRCVMRFGGGLAGSSAVVCGLVLWFCLCLLMFVFVLVFVGVCVFAAVHLEGLPPRLAASFQRCPCGFCLGLALVD